MDNGASQRVHAKFGPRIYARARYIRIMQWYLRKETPILASARDKIVFTLAHDYNRWKV